MKRFDYRWLWGLLLVLAGGLLLLNNLEIVPIQGYIWAALFALTGIAFIVVYFRDREQWWAIIPGLTLLGIGVVAVLADFMPGQMGAWLGAAFLGMIGLAFWLVFFSRRDFWWAIIPGGVLVTLAIVSGATAVFKGVELGGFFFIGLGLTFLLVGLVRTPDGQMKWAFIPAAVLLIMGLLITAAATSLINYVWPIVIILGGIYLLWRAVVVKRA